MPEDLGTTHVHETGPSNRGYQGDTSCFREGQLWLVLVLVLFIIRGYLAASHRLVRSRSLGGYNGFLVRVAVTSLSSHSRHCMPPEQGLINASDAQPWDYSQLAMPCWEFERLELSFQIKIKRRNGPDTRLCTVAGGPTRKAKEAGWSSTRSFGRTAKAPG